MNYLILLIPIAILVISGIRKVTDKQRGLIERLGKFKRNVAPGLHWIIPAIDKLHLVDVSEQIVDIGHQEIVSYDNHLTDVNARVYFKVKSDDESVKGFIYNVKNYKHQLFNLTRSSLRNIISSLTFNSANSESANINSELHNSLVSETNNWGIEILDIELQKNILDTDVRDNNMIFLSQINSFLDNLN